MKLPGVVSGQEPIITPPLPLSSSALAKLALPGSCVGGLAGMGLTVGLAVLSNGNLPAGLPNIVGLGAAFGLSGAVLGFLTGIGRRSRVYRRAVTAAELNYLARDNHETLGAAYVAVIKALIALSPPGDVSVAQNIRNTLRCLGEAVENLPSEPAGDVFANPAALQAEVTQLAAKARGEADPVVAASWERQAEALTRRAETITRTATLIRRHQTLRDEVAAQIGAFQTSLAAARIHDSPEIGNFAALAESVAQVMQEANALADARTELDAVLGTTMTPQIPAIVTVTR